MIYSQLVTYFDVLLDKIASPYFSTAEKDMFLTMGQLEYVKREMPSNEGGTVNLESTQLDYTNVSSLVYDVTGMSMSSAGILPFTTVQTKLDTASGSTELLMYILNVSSYDGTSSYPVHYTRQNDWYEFERNSLKKGTATSPRYKNNKTNLIFSPADTTAVISMTILKTPKDISSSSSVTSELPAHTHKTVVELAIELAAVAIREGELMQANSIQENK